MIARFLLIVLWLGAIKSPAFPCLKLFSQAVAVGCKTIVRRYLFSRLRPR